MKKCPFCAEEIQDEAIVCKHCGMNVKTGTRSATAGERKWSPGVAALLSFIIPGAGQMYRGDVIMGLVWLVLEAKSAGLLQ